MSGRSKPKRWGLIVLVILAMLAVAAAIAWRVLRPHKPTPAETGAEMKAQAQLTGGAKTYAASCAYCHEAAAHGPRIGPSLHGRQLPAAAVQTLVRRGVNTMPAFTPSLLSEAALAELALYVEQLPVENAK